MTLLDEVVKFLEERRDIHFDWDCGQCQALAEDLAAMLEQKVTEAQAATVALCAEVLHFWHESSEAEWKAKYPNFPDDPEGVIRALSPDPHAKERWELDARLETLASIPMLGNGQLDDWISARYADLDRQLAALPKN